MNAFDYMTEVDFNKQPIVITMALIRTKLIEQFGPGGSRLDIILLQEYAIDRFIGNMTIEIYEIPTDNDKLLDYHDNINALVLCVGKSLAIIKQTLPTLSIEQLIDNVSREFNFVYE